VEEVVGWVGQVRRVRVVRFHHRKTGLVGVEEALRSGQVGLG
jgi:hypothetical protein